MNAITPIRAAAPQRSDAQRIVERADRLAADRANHESLWRTIGDVIRPLRYDVGRAEVTPGARRGSGRIYDSTPQRAHSAFSAGMYSMLSSPATEWFGLSVAGDPELSEFEPVKQWLEAVSSRARLSFSTSLSAFYEQVIPLYKDFGAFGTGVFYSAERPGGGIYDACRTLGECYADVNEWDEIDVTYRKFQLTARQAVQKWGERLSEKIRTAAQKNPEQKFTFVHAVEPNEDVQPGRAGPDGKPWRSVYVEHASKSELQRGGFEDFPFQWPRWEVAANEIYGRGIGEASLADTLTLHAQGKTNLRAGQFIAEPPLNAFSDLATGGNGGVRLYPSAVNYGGLNAQGQAMIAPMFMGKNLPISLEMQQATREQVLEAWYFALMQTAMAPNMTATEWLGRQEEKLRLMGPYLGQIETGFLAPAVKRRFGILWRAGQIPPPPEELADQELEVEFVSQLARLQKTMEANAAIRVVQVAGQMAEIGITDGLDRIDGDEVMDLVAESYGAPKVLRSKEDAQEIRDQRAQAAQAEKMAAAAPGVAKAAKDGVDAMNAIGAGGETQAAA